METTSNLEVEKFIRIRCKSDLIRVIIQDENSKTYVMMLDKSKFPNIESYCAHVLKLLKRQTSNSYSLLLSPWHLINDINTLQTNDELVLTNTAHYNNMISERKNRNLQTFKGATLQYKNDDSADTAPGYRISSNAALYSTGPLPLSGEVPKVLQSSEQDINKNLELNESIQIEFTSNTVMTNFDLSAVDVRDIMELNRLKELVKIAASNIGVDITVLTSNGDNWLTFKWKEDGWKFKLIYRKYNDGKYMLYGAIMAHNHAKILYNDIQKHISETQLKELPWDEDNVNSQQIHDNEESFSNDLTADIAKENMNSYREHKLNIKEDDQSKDAIDLKINTKTAKPSEKVICKQSDESILSDSKNPDAANNIQFDNDIEMDDETRESLELIIENEDIENDLNLLKAEQQTKAKPKHSKYSTNPYENLN